MILRTKVNKSKKEINELEEEARDIVRTMLDVKFMYAVRGMYKTYMNIGAVTIL